MLEVSILRLHGQVQPEMFLQAPHEMLGYGDANTETRYGNVMFSAYMNEASAAAAAIVILSKLVTGVTPV
jgi:hypothetical protein